MMADAMHVRLEIHQLVLTIESGSASKSVLFRLTVLVVVVLVRLNTSYLENWDNLRAVRAKKYLPQKYCGVACGTKSKV